MKRAPRSRQRHDLYAKYHDYDSEISDLLGECGSKTFAKDRERLSRSGRYDMHRLKAAMLLLIANEEPLGPEWLDHALKGDWAGHRECHIGGDFLLAYKLDDSGKTGLVVFVRAGTHAELFSE